MNSTRTLTVGCVPGPLPRCRALSLETVRMVIQAAEAAATTDGDFYDSRAEDAFVRLPNPAAKASYALVESLSREEKEELLALMYLGRGGPAEQIDDFGDLLTSSAEEEDEALVGMTTGLAVLGRYLTEGLERLMLTLSMDGSLPKDSDRSGDTDQMEALGDQG